MKLINEQIKFIDTYLENSGVEFFDIRFEMTDHVAAALEEQKGDFYDNFKEYMLQHKKELLASNVKFTKLAGKRALKILLSSFFKPLTLIVVIAFVMVAKVLHLYIAEKLLADVIVAGFLVVGIFFMIYYRFYHRPNESKYSVVAKLRTIVPTVLYVILVVIRPDRLLESILALITFYSFFTAFMISTFVSYRELALTYKLRYNGDEK